MAMRNNFRSSISTMIIIMGMLLVSSLFSTTTADFNGITPDEEIISDDLWEGVIITYENESLIINNNVNLTMVDSHIQFSNYSDTGIIIKGGTLKLVNTIVEFGDKCISGDTNGTVTIYDSKIQNCLDDSIELEGDYNFNFVNSSVINSGGKGIDIFGLSLATITNSEFIDLTDRAIAAENIDYISVIEVSVTNVAEDRGMRFEGTGDVHVSDVIIKNVAGDALRSDVDGNVLIKNINIDGTPDDGIQIENAENATIVNALIDNAIGDAIKGEAFTLLHGFDITATNIGGDGVDITEAGNAVFSNVSLITTADTGFEADFMIDITLSNSLIQTSGEFGIEIANTTTFLVENTKIEDSEDVGVFLDSVSDFTMKYSAVTGNAGGFLLVNVSSSEIHNSVIMDNGEYAINATAVSEGVTVEATNNYWGTTSIEDIVIHGEVSIEPILNSDMGKVFTESETQNGNFKITLFIVAFVALPILRRLRD